MDLRDPEVIPVVAVHKMGEWLPAGLSRFQPLFALTRPDIEPHDERPTGIGKRKLTVPTAAFAGTLGIEIKLLKPRDPESKGMVERNNRFFRQRFMPGRAFASPQDFNAQMDNWLPIANARQFRSRRLRPAELIGQDRAAMRSLSPVVPDVLFRTTVRLPRDYYVRVHSNDYSVDPGLFGRLVDVSASLDTLTISHDGTPIRRHDRAWARQLTVTDPAHVARAGELRSHYQSLRPRPVAEFVETRSLASYDEAFGVDMEPPATSWPGAS